MDVHATLLAELDESLPSQKYFATKYCIIPCDVFY